MTKTVYTTLVYIHAIVSFAFAKNQQFVRTGNYVKTYWNGPDGECEAPKSNLYIGDGCSAGWKKDKSNNFARQTSENKSGCRFYQRTSLFSCPKSKRAKNAVICWKSVSLYIIRPTCAGIWLNWGECDAFCGVGTKIRVKFVTSDGKGYQQISEHRPCKIRSCGEWSDWSDGKECKNDNCTKIFQRNCIYNNSVAPVKFCSGRITDGNATADVFEIPCSLEDCIGTTTSLTTQHETSTVVTQSSTQSTTDDSEIGISTTVQPQIVTNASEITVRNATDIFSTTVLSDWPTEEATFALLAVSQNPGSTIDIWKGLLIGVFAASFLYGIAFFIFYRRKSSRNRRKSRDYYDHDKTKHASIVIQEGSNIENLHNPLLDPTRTQTLPHSQLQVSRTNTLPLPKAPSIITHCNQLCNDETDPLYSNIPAFENVTLDIPCNSNIDYRDSIGDSENDEPRPDMFEGESESLDSEEMRDVLRTLKRPSSKFKKKASSLKESSLSLLRSEFNRDNNLAKGRSLRNTTANKGNREVSNEFSWAKPSAFSGRFPFHKRTSIAQQAAMSTSSMTSLNIDTATSGYNSSIADESTDDEYGAKILTQTSQPRQSRLRKSAKFLRRKLSMSQNKIITNPRAEEDVSDSRRMPPGPPSGITGMDMTGADFSTCDAKPFLTMKPARNHGFFVLSRNDRFVIVEDEYSLPIDAVTHVRPASPNFGYNVPFDALCKCSDPT